MSMDRNSNPGISQEDILELALERLMAGESLDMILAGAGADAGWLQPLLAAAAGVQDLRQVVTVPPADASLKRFLAHARQAAPGARSEQATRRWWERLGDRLRLPSIGFPRLVTTAVSAVLALVVFMVGTALFLGYPSAAAAKDVLPGQWLYSLKRVGEEMYLWLPQSSQSRNAKFFEYERRRQEEVRMLVDRRLEADVSFQGQIERLGAEEIVVDGITLQIVDETQVQGDLAVGAQVAVQARSLSSGTLVAERLVVQQPPQVPAATPSPTPLPTDTPAPTATATPSPSATPEPTNTPVDTATPEPTPVPAADPTYTTAPSPTAPLQPTATAAPRVLPTEETPEATEEKTETGDDDGEGNDNDNAAEDNENEEPQDDDNQNGDDANDNNGEGDDDSNDNDNDTDEDGDQEKDDSNDNDDSSGQNSNDNNDSSGQNNNDDDD